MPKNNLSHFLNYLASIPVDADQRIPPLSELSKDMGLSIATLREQMEAARLLGVVDARPKVGIRKVQFIFKRAIKPAFEYAVASDSISFHQFADLRKHLESSYFIEAAQRLTASDISRLEDLIQSAQTKIATFPGQTPTEEHREFHTFFYHRLDNPYLDGMLDAFWDVYHLNGYEVYPDLGYIERIWQYHARIIGQIKTGNYAQGLSLLLEHMDLVNQREKVIPRLSFE